jgi:hypothetical protein
MYASGMRAFALEANRKNTEIGKGRLAACRQNADGETHLCTLIAALCLLRLASVPIIPTQSCWRLSRPSPPLCDAFQAVLAMKVQLKPLVDTPTPCIYAEAPSKVGREMTRRRALEGGYEEGEDTCARDAAGVTSTVGCQGITARHCA